MVQNTQPLHTGLNDYNNYLRNIVQSLCHPFGAMGITNDFCAIIVSPLRGECFVSDQYNFEKKITPKGLNY